MRPNLACTTGFRAKRERRGIAYAEDDTRHSASGVVDHSTRVVRRKIVDMLSAREALYYEKRDNFRIYGHRVLDGEITGMVIDELAPLLGDEVISMLSPVARLWISEQINNNYKKEHARQPDISSSPSGQTSLGESEESYIPLRSNSNSGVLVEDSSGSV